MDRSRLRVGHLRRRRHRQPASDSGLRSGRPHRSQQGGLQPHHASKTPCRSWITTTPPISIPKCASCKAICSPCRSSASSISTSVPNRAGRPKQPNLVADPLQTDSARTTALLGGFKGNLQVSLIPNTRIIEIHYRSTDPTLAANAVNTLAATYVEQNFKTKFESTMQASDWLSKQLVDLQMKVETSQEKLVRYQKEHEILGIDEKQNIITAEARTN